MTIIAYGDKWLVDGLVFDSLWVAEQYLDWLDNQRKEAI